METPTIQPDIQPTVTTQPKTRGRPRTKNGVYDTKAYYQTFKTKHADRIKTQEVCEYCGGHYTYFNKSHHNKAMKHMKAVYDHDANVVNTQLV